MVFTSREDWEFVGFYSTKGKRIISRRCIFVMADLAVEDISTINVWNGTARTKCDCELLAEGASFASPIQNLLPFVRLCIFERYSRFGRSCTELILGNKLMRLIWQKEDHYYSAKSITTQMRRIHLIRDCWVEAPNDRPTTEKLRQRLRQESAGQSINLMDHVFGMLEQYAIKLEEDVLERTRELEGEKSKSDIEYAVSAWIASKVPTNFFERGIAKLPERWRLVALQRGDYIID